VNPVTQHLSSQDRTPQVAGELIATRRIGAYHHLTFRAPGVAELARPGQFVALAVGGDTSANLLRRCFSIYRVSPAAEISPTDVGASTDVGPSTDAGSPTAAGGAIGIPAPVGIGGGTVEVVIAARGPGTRWLTDLSAGDEVSIIGPLGRGFPLPAEPVACVLVGGGYGSAPLFWLAGELRARGCTVEMVLGAATGDRLFGVAQAGRDADGVTVTTDDGSQGVKGWVSDVLPDVIARTSAGVVYGCGPMAMLRSVTEVATAHGAIAQVAVEESMACGIGVCMTCVMPVTGDDGVTRMVRSCVDGPVFRGDRIRWDAFDHGRCRVPADAYGAAAMGGH
jgi:dihydroorotate dehydrogenase electron transfer subunit